MKAAYILATLVASAIALSACDFRERPAAMDAGGPVIPSVAGYAEGEKILFIHTETSDPKVADLLTKMMRSPVLVVPALADTPDAARANVYVFANGVQPRGNRGPFGYQPDVFDAPPDTPAYSPLRTVHIVTWKDPTRARMLTSASEVRQAEAAGEVTIERPGAVVNMPFLTWPRGGER